MANSTLRASGLVLNQSRRRGQSKTSGNDYDIRSYTLLVGGSGVAEVTCMDLENIGGQLVDNGETVDWLVEVGTYNGQPQLTVVGVFDPSKVIEIVTA